MKFMPEPVAVWDRTQTLDMLRHAGWMLNPHPYKWRVKSSWLCQRLNAFEADGYVYNADALHRIEKEEGIGPFAENGSPLSILIYNAQAYRRHDALIAAGWEPGSEAHLAAAGEGGKIALLTENIVGGESKMILTVKRIGGKLYAMQPRKRKFAVNIIGQPVKVLS